MADILRQLRKELAAQADEKTRQSSLRFFKERIQLYGVKTPIVQRIGKAMYKTLPDKSKGAVFDLCETLWQSGKIEEGFIACQWSYACKKMYQPEDFKKFEKWVKTYITNWATCDTLCNHTVGDFLEMYPAFLPKLIAWTQSENRWVRRAASVSLIVPAKKGKFLKEVFAIADQLLLDTDDLVQKGYGWMLKAASAKHAEAVLAYVVKHKASMPRTALRYAIEKMTPAQKAKAMTRT